MSTSNEDAVTVPCESDPAVLTLEIEAAWEALRICAEQLAYERSNVSMQRRDAARQQPMVAAFNQISRDIGEWERRPYARPAEHVLNSIQSTIAAARRRIEEIRAIQKAAE